MDNLLDALARQSGLAARYLASGVGGLGATLANPLAWGANQALEAAGAEYRFPEQYQLLQDALTAAGLPEPEGALERGVGFASELGVPDPSDSARVVSALSHMVDPGSMDNLIQAMTVFHGSPHKWDRVDLSKVGTGEGAQAYGHGFYAAENKDVAKDYFRRFQKHGQMEYTDEVKEKYFPIWDDLKARRDAVDEQYMRVMSRNARGDFDGPSASDLSRQRDELEEQLDHLQERMVREGGSAPAHLYELDIPDETIAKMLDWDAPLSEQPESVRKALIPDIRDLHLDSSSGERIYHELSRVYGGPGGASAALAELGVPGIKYLDGTSRRAGEGTRNFVVFDEQYIKPLRRDGEDIR